MKPSSGNPHLASGKNGGRLRTWIFALVTVTASSLVGLVIIDKIAGVIRARHVNLIFPAETTVVHESTEFKYEARINSLGFRDHEVGPKVPGRRRIVVIGDSYVYGWGVAIDEAWPKVLEADLKQAGQNVEVFCVGCPGHGPSDYARVAQRAIPVLKPDLVIVGILQGDDLIQERHALDLEAAPSSVSLRKRIVNLLAPNLYALVRGEFHLTHMTLPPTAVRGDQREEVENILRTLTPEQRQRLDHVDREAYELWRNGDLNPYLIIMAMERPDFFMFTLHPERADVREAIDRMTSSLQEIRRQAEKVGATAIAVSEPYSAYVVNDGRVQKFGFQLTEAALTATAQDDTIETACKRAGVKFYQVTELFRREAKTQNLYFKFDGHFTPTGNRVFADAIARACFGINAVAK